MIAEAHVVLISLDNKNNIAFLNIFICILNIPNSCLQNKLYLACRNNRKNELISALSKRATRDVGPTASHEGMLRIIGHILIRCSTALSVTGGKLYN